MTRKYTQRRRAEKQIETRERILDAVVALHEELGPAQTSISAIAERASVQRLTVYRHFPDEQALFAACRDHWMASHPLPDPESWKGIEQPNERLHHGLMEMYAYYERGEQMFDHVIRDAAVNEAIARAQQPVLAGLGHIQTVLVDGWDIQEERADILNALVAHAVHFLTWQSLARHHGLSASQIAELMVCLAECSVRGDC